MTRSPSAKRKEISQLLTEWDLGMRLVLSLCRVYLVLWRVVLLLRVLSLWRVLALWRVLFLVRGFVPLTSVMPTTIVDRVVWSTTSGTKTLLLFYSYDRDWLYFDNTWWAPKKICTKLEIRTLYASPKFASSVSDSGLHSSFLHAFVLRLIEMVSFGFFPRIWCLLLVETGSRRRRRIQEWVG